MKRSADPGGPGTDNAAARPAAVQLRARRSPRLIVLGILAVALGGLGAASLYAAATSSESAVVMAKDVARGQEITQADLAVISVPAGLPMDTTSGSDMASLVGRTALTDLPAGAFPASRLLGTPPVPEGHAVVGVNLTPGRIPRTSLPVGTRVQLVSLADGKPESFDAVVAAAPTHLDDGTGHVLDVAVPVASAPRVAVLAATENLALIAVGS